MAHDEKIEQILARVWKGLNKGKLRVWALPAVAISLIGLLWILGAMNSGSETPIAGGDVSGGDGETGDDGGDAPEITENAIYKKTLRSVVFIHHDEGSGSGFLVDRADRLVVTAFHVVENKSNVWVTFPAFKHDGTVITEREHYFDDDGEQIRAKVVHELRIKDLAVLQLVKVPSQFVAVKLASNPVEQMDPIYTVGTPGAGAGMWTGTKGGVTNRVSQYEFTLDGGQQVVADIIQTQNPTNPGDSGGPVVNSRGELVGVTCAGGAGADLVSLCIDAIEVQRMLTRYRQQ